MRYISRMLFSRLKQLGLMVGLALFLANPASAASYDDKAAIIFAYFSIGNDDAPSTSVRKEQFIQHISELAEGGYNILPLPKVIDAFTEGAALPPRAVAITFDGADKSVIETALPLLKKYEIPFTVFIPAGAVSLSKPPFMTWDDLQKLKRTGLATFGLHPASYGRISDQRDSEITRQINNSIADIRKELDVNPTLFSYPFGEYDEAYKSIVTKMGFKAAFGQQSGVAWGGGDRHALPRFALTERYGDMDRFLMAANALPLPASDISPDDPHLNSLTPSIGFTVPEDLRKSLKSLSCFSSGEEQSELQILGSRVEVRMSKPLNENRPRINCTIPVAGEPGEEARFRWLGMLYTVPQDLLDEAAAKEESIPQKHAGENVDSINME